MRERNALLIAAGHALAFVETQLDHPALQAERQAVELALADHEPFGAF